MIRCPSAMRQRTHEPSVSAGACTTAREVRHERSTPPPSARPAAGSTRAASLRPSSRSTSSRIAAAISSFGAFATRRSPRADDEHHLVVGRVEADVRRAHVVEDDEVDVLVGELLARALEARLALRRRAKPTSTCPFVRRSPSAASTSVGRLERDRPGVAGPSAACPRAARPGGSRRPRPPSGRRPRRARASASRARSAAVGVSTTSTPAGAGTARFAREQRHLARRAAAPPRRARRPSGPTSGCRRSAPRRAARASRPR